MYHEDQKLNAAVRNMARRARLKNYLGAAAYLASVPLAFVSPFLAYGIFLIPTALFFMPDGVAAASDDVPPVQPGDAEAATTGKRDAQN
jgi:hypothetical protein